MANPSESSISDEFEIGDVETYANQKDSGFSHQVLVMNSMKKVLENGSKEMRPGWWETKIDRNGNQSRIYNEDTREVFISSVECTLMVMECDLDKEAKDDLEKINNYLEDKKNYLLSQEENEWNQLFKQIQLKLSKEGKGFIKGYFNKDKRFYQEFLDEKVKAYRAIFKCLTRLTQRKDFYAAEVFEA